MLFRTAGGLAAWVPRAGLRLSYTPCFLKRCRSLASSDDSPVLMAGHTKWLASSFAERHGPREGEGAGGTRWVDPSKAVRYEGYGPGGAAIVGGFRDG